MMFRPPKANSAQPPSLVEVIKPLEVLPKEETNLKNRLENRLFTQSEHSKELFFKEDILWRLIQLKIGENETDYVQRAFLIYLKEKVKQLLKAYNESLPASHPFQAKIKKIACILIDAALSVQIPYATLPHYQNHIERINSDTIGVFEEKYKLGFELEEGYDLNPDSFSRYLEKFDRISIPFPSSNNNVQEKRYTPAAFIQESISSIKDHYHALTAFKQLIQDISTLINQYDENGNKIRLIKKFNEAIEEHKKNLGEHSKEENLTKLRSILTDLQTGEDNHYQSMCFSFFQKLNSHLQPKIDEALKLLQDYSTNLSTIPKFR